MKDATFSSARLLALYDRISDAPDAIPRLRRFVLELAVRGKLVEQDAADEQATDLVKRLGKARLDQGGHPANWLPAKLGELLNLQYGKGLDAKLRQDSGPVPVFGSNGIVSYTASALTQHPSIVVGRKGSAGALNLCNGPSWTTDVAYFVENPSFFSLRYLYNLLSSLNLGGLGKGVKPGLSRPDVYELLVLVPPLVEQDRIVAKVDELMALCDQLEQASAEREAVRDLLTTASLARLTAPDTDAETFQSHARFALRSLLTLTTRPDQIKTLRQTILNLAVRGKLVAQDAADEPASELLKRVGQEIFAYSKSNRIGLTLPSPLSDEEKLFALPDGWQWTRLCGLFNVITDSDHQPPPKADEGVAFLTIGNVTTGKLDFDGCRIVPRAYYEGLAPYRTPAKGDILYIVVGATYGRPALVDADRAFCVQRHIAIMKPSTALNLRFLLFLLGSPLIYEQATNGTTGTAQPTIALRPLRNFVTALPALAEQQRIVARVDALMALCDQLEASLTTATTTRSRLLEALLHEALEPAGLATEAAE